MGATEPGQGPPVCTTSSQKLKLVSSMSPDTRYLTFIMDTSVSEIERFRQVKGGLALRSWAKRNEGEFIFGDVSLYP